MKIRSTIIIGLVSLGLRAGDGYLYTRYLQAQVIDQVYAQQAQLTDGLTASTAAEVGDAFDQWRKQQLGTLRQDLEKALGGEAKSEFSDFIQRYHAAKSEEDDAFLNHLANDLRISRTPESYQALQESVMNRSQDSLLPEAAKFLSEVQTWTEENDSEVPLHIWLTRDAPTAAAPAPTPKPVPTVNPLQAAEAGGATWVPPEDELVNPMDAFAQSRQSKREQALEDAHAGMRQVASEREAYESEQAAKVLAKAQADAEAMRAQAQRLAATEEEALAQRENSWGNRLKRIVGGTVSAATGAFTGGIGAEAGQRAANAVLN